MAQAGPLTFNQLLYSHLPGSLPYRAALDGGYIVSRHTLWLVSHPCTLLPRLCDEETTSGPSAPTLLLCSARPNPALKRLGKLPCTLAGLSLTPKETPQ